MIDATSINHKGLADLFENGKSRKIEQKLVGRIKLRLSVLNAVEDIKDTANSYGTLGIHQLSGKRRGTWSMSVNGPWRLTFKFRNGNVYDLNLEQYH